MDVDQPVVVDVILGEARHGHARTGGQFQLAVGRSARHRVGHGGGRLFAVGKEQLRR